MLALFHFYLHILSGGRKACGAKVGDLVAIHRIQEAPMLGLRSCAKSCREMRRLGRLSPCVYALAIGGAAPGELRARDRDDVIDFGASLHRGYQEALPHMVFPSVACLTARQKVGVSLNPSLQTAIDRMLSEGVLRAAHRCKTALPSASREEGHSTRCRSQGAPVRGAGPQRMAQHCESSLH